MNLWETLKDKNLVKGEMPETTNKDQFDSIWYIRLMQGFAGLDSRLVYDGFFLL